MSLPTVPIARMARFLPILVMVGFTLMMVPNSGCGKGIFPEVTPTITATTVPTITATATASTPTSTAPTATATPHGANEQFSMRGSGIEATPTVGTCNGSGCGGSSKHCECLTFSGTLLSTVIGDSNWTANVTVNEDDCTATGTSAGFCCIGDGTFNATNGTGKSANALALSFTGNICEDANASLDSSLQAPFEILTSTSGGKFANSNGTGQINIFTNGTNAYLTALGQIQLGKP
jgi:hypothetical protein